MLLKRIQKTKIKSGDILLFHTKGFSSISWAIRSLTLRYWNHVGIIVNESDYVYVVEALFRGVAKTPLKKYLNNSKYVIQSIRVKRNAYRTKQEYLRAIKTAIRRAKVSVGYKYDYPSIAYLGIKYLARGFLKKILPQTWNPLNSRLAFFCSELVCYCYSKTSSRYKNIFAGEKHPHQKCDTITPKDIAKSRHVYKILWEEI
ncbi:MAG: hypothetical protein DRP74_06585 [Candidatus Omnitrophota bacterium]|nr:MAG: hypothetical protein DRP74_06585 [Candidatus Omnitrophota bacterium]